MTRIVTVGAARLGPIARDERREDESLTQSAKGVIRPGAETHGNG